jgi:L-2-hydroxyglutarate oxidase
MVSRVTVIGGGILGLAIAERMSRQGSAVTLLEKEDHFAAHQTGHNSGVIHAGPYYAPGSLKARLCATGNRSMIAFAREHGIPFDVPGKLIVATSVKELPRLTVLHERALANGAEARLIGAAEARDYEPNVSAVGALRVETTGIVDYARVSRMLAELARSHGAKLLLGAPVHAIRTTTHGVEVAHSGGTVSSELLINCAGLQSDRIAALAGLSPEIRIIPFRGEYYELVESRRNLVRGLIYPVPDPALPFLGVHLTRMIDGSVHAGPNAVLALAREGYGNRSFNLRDAASSIGYPGFLRLASRNIGTGAQEIMRSFSKRLFAASLARLVPAIGPDDIVRAGSGIRAQAIRPDGTLADDFIIQRAHRQVHILNAPSPAATSSLEIARYVVDQLADEL